MTSRPPTPPRRRETIPRLTTIKPSIFVPMPDDFLTSPPATARTTLDTQAAGVKANIIRLTQRECIRVQHIPPVRKPASRNDLARMVANMGGEKATGPDEKSNPTPAEVVHQDMLQVIQLAMEHVHGYEKHVAAVKAREGLTD